MDGNTIFEGIQDEVPNAPQSGAQQTSAATNSQPSVTPQQILASSNGTPPPPSIPKTGSASRSFFQKISLSVLLKLLLGIFVVAVLVLIGSWVLKVYFAPKATESVKLVYWGLWEDASIMKPVISEFEKKNPHITVEYIKQDPKQYRERFLNRIQQGEGPDIFRYHNTWLPMLSKNLLPMPEEVIKKDEFSKMYYPVVQNDLTKNGAIYGIPLGIDTLALFVNDEMIQSAGVDTPRTWNEFLSVSRLMTVKDEDGKIQTAGAALGTMTNVTHAPDIISLLLLQNGADIQKLDETQKNASVALKFYTLFADSSEGGVWDDTLDPSILAFSKGNVGMYFGYSWDVFYIEAKSKEAGSNLSYKIYPVPFVPGGKDVTIASYWVEGVSAKTKHPEEAFLFMKFLTQKETQQKKFSESSKTRLFGEPYSRADLADLLKDNQLVYPFVEQASQAVSSYFVSDTQDEGGINFRMNEYLEKAIESILQNTSPDTAVETLSQGVSQVLQQYGIQ